MTAPRQFRLDCRSFRGDKPCEYGNACEGCLHYRPRSPRILIIKLDALGDVLRTTCVLRGLSKVYPDPSIVWLVDPSALGILENNPMLDEALPYDLGSLMRLQVERYDLVLSLDKTPRSAAVAMAVKAPEKRGFGLTEHGTICPLNPGAEYAFELGLCDDLKFRRNTRTYQDVIFQCAGLPYAGEECVFQLSKAGEAFQRRVAEEHGLLNGRGPRRGVVGINCGGGSAFANKMWAAEQIIEFVRHLKSRAGAAVLLYGAQREAQKIEAVVHAVGADVIHTGLDNTLEEFAALVGLADVVVTGDSLGMHFAVALGRQVVALFGPTCAQEIELYGRGKRIVSPLDCAPCYKRECRRSPTCMEALSPQAVAEEVASLL